MTQIFIIGFGKFGKLALSQMRRLGRESRIWIIDRDPDVLASERPLAGIRVLADGPRFLAEYQQWIGDEDWIIPALPIHLAWKWLDLNLKTVRSHKNIAPPLHLGDGLPFSRLSGEGLLVSYATFLCPENCPAPLRICFKTKEKRSAPLWKILAERDGLKGSLTVIESRQMAPGVGGYPFKELRRLPAQSQNSRSPFYLATACRCHGIINGLKWSGKKISGNNSR
jgi:hypothetical protein